MTETEQSKTKLKKVIFCLLFVTFSKGGTIRQKANARAWNHADHSNSKIEWRTHLSYHGLNDISLHSVGFELFKKVLLVRKSKKISNDQELIQSDPISCPQNQKGNN